MNTLTRRSLVLVTAMVATAGLAACGSSDSSTATPAAATTEAAPMATATASDAMASGLVGPGCAGYAAQVPDGAGSVAGMAQDPVATAASNNPLLTKLVAAVGAANLGDTLNSQPAITVFAPYDPAFAELGDAKFAELAADPATLGKILQYHVVGKRYDAKGLEAAKTVDSLTGQKLTIAGSGDTMTVNGAPVLCGNIPTKNATVFVIGKVLTPPAA